MNNPRVAIVGFALEANAFSPVSTRTDFTESCWEEGEQISGLARSLNHLPAEVAGFYERMDAIGPWTPVPLIVVSAPPGGPAAAEVWSAFMATMAQRLREALPVDAVYVANHGASSAVGEDDTEAEMMTSIRAIVGTAVPIVVTHDLHCNVSQRTVDAIDALISYRTNPHVDQRERAAEAADLLHEIFGGIRTEIAYIRMPITPPSVTLLTARGPYADLVRMGTAMMQSPQEGPIANVSVSAGFVFSDLPKCGITITVTSRGDRAAAERCALAIAQAAWDDRARYVADTIEVPAAVAMARDCRTALLFADVADNPGGGGGGNTAWLLQAFHEARVPGVVLGMFVDAALAEQAHELRPGDTFEAVFNRTETDHAKRFVASARIVCLRNDKLIGRRGILQGRQFSIGRSVLLELTDSGLQVLVGSLRRQLAEPVMLESHGIDITKVSVLIVKSRGHYRAGFDEFFPDAQIFDVDSHGLTTPNLKRVAFQRLPRPVWPLDESTPWSAPAFG